MLDYSQVVDSVNLARRLRRKNNSRFRATPPRLVRQGCEPSEISFTGSRSLTWALGGSNTSPPMLPVFVSHVPEMNRPSTARITPQTAEYRIYVCRGGQARSKYRRHWTSYIGVGSLGTSVMKFYMALAMLELFVRFNHRGKNRLRHLSLPVT